MLRLEKIELRGFKSFADPTELVFPSPITAIVGPNGCGKSNIADAIAWVLGEQSARLLRGTRMEDVIFQGTRARPALGMAEVILTLVATEDIRLGGEPGEDGDEEDPRPASFIPSGTTVMVARRLYRSGQSEYLIDGRPVRLRDIYDLFAGTGLGPGHYALIGQDRVTALIQARPVERRAVIEEAAGITRLKLRERSTELRLESARQNLARIHDLIAEVARQVSALRRQAARARRYRRLREELRALLRFLFRSEYRRLESALEEVSQRITALERARAEVLARLAAVEAEHQQLLQQERARQMRIATARDRLAQIEIELERIRGERRQCEQHREDLRMREQALEREESSLAERLRVIEEELTRLVSEAEKVSGEVAEQQEAVRAEEHMYHQHWESVRAREKQLEQMRAPYVEAIGQVAHWRNAEQQIAEAMRRLEAHLRRLAAERERAALRETHLVGEQERLRQQVEVQRAHLEALRRQYEDVTARLHEARQHQARVRAEWADVEKAAIAAEHRLASLVELQQRYAYASRAVQYLFELSRQNGHVRLLGTLADILRVAPESESMVEGFLGERLQAVLVPSLEDARAALAALASARIGRAQFLVVQEETAREEKKEERSGGPSDGGDGEGPREGFWEILGVKPSVARALRRAFPECEQVTIAEDLEAAIRRSAEDPRGVFLTRHGEWIRGGVLLVGGREGEQSAGILAVKREILELRERCQDLAQQLEELQQKQRSCETALEELARESAHLETALKEQERALFESEVRLSEVERDLARTRQHLAVVEFERAAAEQERARLAQEYENALAERARAEERLRALEAEQAAEQQALTELRRAGEALAERLAARRIHVATVSERERAVQAQVRRLQQEQQHVAGRLEDLRRERQSLRQEREQCAQREQFLQQCERQCEEARQQAYAEVHQASEQVSGAHAATDSLAEHLNALRREESDLRERLTAEEVQRAALLAEMRHVSASCRAELGESAEDLIASASETEGATDLSPDDPQSVRARIEDVRRKIEELGPINLMALEELQQAEERLSFLQAQREDIERSIATTEEALREIRRRARRRFLSAFEAINAHFEETFRELFGGGRGEMLLLDPDDVLQSGVEIVAQPPGKRLQNLHLLSGGEKALTALALLLAIFRHRPSPFCVLDEVDAPLDDVNIARFCRQITQMSSRTQFILITHNKETMEIADVLYGVTMEEPGVSKVVSVRLK